MFFSKAFFVLSFAALALAVPVADPPQQADAGTFCLGGTSVRHKSDQTNLGPGGLVNAAVNAVVKEVNVDVLSTGSSVDNN
jgi:hypothetical protein